MHQGFLGNCYGSEQSLLFPRDVFMNGVFYFGNDFSLTTTFEVPPGDRNAPPYNNFRNDNATNSIGLNAGDHDYNGNGILDNQNPFPFTIRREVTLLGKRVSPDHLEGTYVEAIQNLLPNGQRIYIEGDFSLDRQNYAPTLRSIYNGKTTNNPVAIGGSYQTSYTNLLAMSSPVQVQGVTVSASLTYPSGMA